MFASASQPLLIPFPQPGIFSPLDLFNPSQPGSRPLLHEASPARPGFPLLLSLCSLARVTGTPGYLLINTERWDTIPSGDYRLLNLLYTRQCACFHINLHHKSEKQVLLANVMYSHSKILKCEIDGISPLQFPGGSLPSPGKIHICFCQNQGATQRPL